MAINVAEARSPYKNNPYLIKREINPQLLKEAQEELINDNH